MQTNLDSIDILLVEDNPADAELTTRELEKYDFASSLYHVKDGEAALDFIFAQGIYTNSRNIARLPKLILLDLQLPKIDGIGVLTKIRSDFRLRQLPVVILTGTNESPDIRKCYELGAKSYIVKPLHFEYFIEAIKETSLYWKVLNTLVE
ncbi:MAG TPA: response regulator [Chryseolinea sp.]|nr:response regulator [Chryseolinea sp.]